MILITGASGNLGTLTIGFLSKLTSTSNITALVRSEEKGQDLAAKGIALKVGDYWNIDSINAALEGIDTLVLISSGSIEDRFAQHRNVIEAAVKIGITHLVYTSVMKPNSQSKFVPGIDHFHTEALIRDSGIPYTILRNTFYFEVLPMFLADSLQSGQWFYPSRGAVLNLASRVDMAEALAVVAADPASHKNKVYNIAAPQGYTLEQIAGMVREKVNPSYAYVDVPQEAFVEGLEKAGLPPAHVAMIAGIAEAIQDGELSESSNDLATLLGREPLALNDFISSAFPKA